MSETIKVTREVYNELIDIWASPNDLDEEYEKVKFFKNSMPEGWREGDSGLGTTAGEGEWIRLEDHGTTENWEKFKETVEKARENVEKEENQ